MVSSPDQYSAPPIEDLISILRRRIVVISGVFSMITLFGSTLLLAKPKSYVSTSQLVVQFPNSNLQTGDSSQMTGLTVSERFSVSTQAEILTNEKLRKTAAAAIGGVVSPTDPQTIKVDQRSVKLLTANPDNTALLNVSGESSDPALAAQAVNSLVDNFLKQSRSIQIGDLQGSKKRLGQWRQISTRALNAANQQMAQLQSKFSSAAPAKDVEQSIESYNSMQIQVANATSQLAAAEANLRVLSKEESGLPAVEQTIPDPNSDQSIQTEETNLIQLRAQRQGLLQRHTEANPDVLAITAQIAALEKEITAHKKTVGRTERFNPDKRILQNQIEQVRADVASKRSALAGLQGTEGSLRDRLHSFPVFMLQVGNVSAEIDKQRKEIEKYDALISQINTQIRTTASEVRLVSPAYVPTNPQGGAPGMMIALNAIVALILGCIAGVAADRVDGRLRRHTHLGAIPLIGIIAAPGQDRSGQPISEVGILGARNVLARLRLGLASATNDRLVLVPVDDPRDGALASASLALAAAVGGKPVTVTIPDSILEGKRAEMFSAIDAHVRPHRLGDSASVVLLDGSREVPDLLPEQGNPFSIVATSLMDDLLSLVEAARDDSVVLIGRLDANTKSEIVEAVEKLQSIGVNFKGVVLIDGSNRSSSYQGRDVRLQSIPLNPAMELSRLEKISAMSAASAKTRLQ